MAPYGAIWRENGAIMAPYGGPWRHFRHMAPLNGVGGDKNGAPPFFIWQKQEHAPYGGTGAKWRHMAPFTRHMVPF